MNPGGEDGNTRKTTTGKNTIPQPSLSRTREHGPKVLNSFFNVIDAWRQ